MKMSKINLEKPNDEKKSTKKGFYIALSICLVAIFAAAATTYNNVSNFVSEENQINNLPSEQDNNLKENTDLNNIAALDEKSIDFDNNSETKEANTSPDKEESKDDLVVYPASNNLIKGFSDVNPVYSNTFKDWRVHNGCDFAAEQGSNVKAIKSGKVVDIYDDQALGMTVVIEHDNGVTAYYSGLGDTVLVEKDANVTTGQDIGSINDIPSESADESHLHLSIKKDDKFIDPMTILNKQG